MIKSCNNCRYKTHYLRPINSFCYWDRIKHLKIQRPDITFSFDINRTKQAIKEFRGKTLCDKWGLIWSSKDEPKNYRMPSPPFVSFVTTTINNIKLKYGDNYVANKIDSVRILINCKEHGEQAISASSVDLNKPLCVKCRRVGNKFKQLKSIWGDDYGLTYKTSTEIIIKCKKHGISSRGLGGINLNQNPCVKCQKSEKQIRLGDYIRCTKNHCFNCQYLDKINTYCTIFNQDVIPGDKDKFTRCPKCFEFENAYKLITSKKPPRI